MTELEESRCQEIWLENEEDEQTMMALINGDFGWLMYLYENADAGFSSRNPDYTGPEDATMEFLLSNGQVDQYPLSYVLPVQQVYQALAYFKEHHRPPDFIHWHNDREDGTSIHEPPSEN